MKQIVILNMMKKMAHTELTKPKYIATIEHRHPRLKLGE